MRVETLFIVGVASGVLLGLALVVVWEGLERRAWRVLRRARPARLVAWGGRPQIDVQISSWQDVSRFCGQLLNRVDRRMLRTIVGIPVLEVADRGCWPSGPTCVDIVGREQGVDVFIIGGPLTEDESSWRRVGRLTNIGS